MTLYLQRLFDRAASLQGVAGVTLPTLTTESSPQGACCRQPDHGAIGGYRPRDCMMARRTWTSWRPWIRSYFRLSMASASKTCRRPCPRDQDQGTSEAGSEADITAKRSRSARPPVSRVKDSEPPAVTAPLPRQRPSPFRPAVVSTDLQPAPVVSSTIDLRPPVLPAQPSAPPDLRATADYVEPAAPPSLPVSDPRYTDLWDEITPAHRADASATMSSTRLRDPEVDHAPAERVMPRPVKPAVRVEAETPQTVQPAERPLPELPRQRVEPAPLHTSEPPSVAADITPPRLTETTPRDTRRAAETAGSEAVARPTLSQKPDSPPILSAEQASVIGPLARIRPAAILRGLRRR